MNGKTRKSTINAVRVAGATNGPRKRRVMSERGWDGSKVRHVGERAGGGMAFCISGVSRLPLVGPAFLVASCAKPYVLPDLSQRAIVHLPLPINDVSYWMMAKTAPGSLSFVVSSTRSTKATDRWLDGAMKHRGYGPAEHARWDWWRSNIAPAALLLDALQEWLPEGTWRTELRGGEAGQISRAASPVCADSVAVLPRHDRGGNIGSFFSLQSTHEQFEVSYAQH